MPSKIEIWIQCPKCGDEGYSLDDLIKRFGTRETEGKIIPQSWCKECR